MQDKKEKKDKGDKKEKEHKEKKDKGDKGARMRHSAAHCAWWLALPAGLVLGNGCTVLLPVILRCCCGLAPYALIVRPHQPPLRSPHLRTTTTSR